MDKNTNRFKSLGLIFSIAVLALSLCLSLCACVQSNSTDVSSTQSVSSEASSEASSETSSEASSETSSEASSEASSKASSETSSKPSSKSASSKPVTSTPPKKEPASSAPASSAPIAEPPAPQNPAPSSEPPAPQNPAPIAEPPAPQNPAPSNKPHSSLITKPPTDAAVPEKTPEEPAQNDAYSLASEVIKLTNIEREKEGLSALTYSSSIESRAMIRAKEIVDKFSHTRPDETSCFTVLDGIDYMAAGENLAIGQDSPEAVLTAWMNSPGHRANILNDFKEIGVGVYTATNGKISWVQLFTSDS